MCPGVVTLGLVGLSLTRPSTPHTCANFRLLTSDCCFLLPTHPPSLPFAILFPIPSFCGKHSNCLASFSDSLAVKGPYQAHFDRPMEHSLPEAAHTRVCVSLNAFWLLLLSNQLRPVGTTWN